MIRERLEVASYFHRGVKVTFEDETTGDKKVFQHDEGLADYLKKIVAERGGKPVHEAPFALQKDNGVRAELVLQWTESTDEHLRSYVNGIPTGSGGTHENGFRAGLGKAVRNYIETHKLTPKGVTLTAEDIREGITGVLSLFIQEPQFQGQTKDRLNNPEMLSASTAWCDRRSSIGSITTSRSPKRSSRASSWRRARARPAAPRSRRSCVRARRRVASTLPGKLSRLHASRLDHQRDVHRRGRLRRRLRQAGARPRATGDPSAARQGDEHGRRWRPARCSRTRSLPTS